MVEIAVVSDTHVPSRADEIPEWVCDRVAAADHLVHAGDFDSGAALDRVRELAGGHLTAVAGNMDPESLGLGYVETLDVEGVRFVVTHGTGTLHDYRDRVAQTVSRSDGDVGIAGHTHEVIDVTHRDVRLLNPGSATGAAPASAPSMMSVTVDGGTVEVERHER